MGCSCVTGDHLPILAPPHYPPVTSSITPFRTLCLPLHSLSPSSPPFITVRPALLLLSLRDCCHDPPHHSPLYHTPHPTLDSSNHSPISSLSPPRPHGSHHLPYHLSYSSPHTSPSQLPPPPSSLGQTLQLPWTGEDAGREQEGTERGAAGAGYMRGERR